MNGREIVVGVTGGIAAYKTAMLVSQLVQESAQVTTILTRSAEKFIGAATFAALTGRPVLTQMFDPSRPLGAHIEAAQHADLLCIAPASANFLAKMAHGLADDLLSATYLYFEGPVVVAPAMNCQMWDKPAVQRNVRQVTEDGVRIVGPAEGWLSCRQQGVGRMSEPTTIKAVIAAELEQLL